MTTVVIGDVIQASLWFGEVEKCKALHHQHNLASPKQAGAWYEFSPSVKAHVYGTVRGPRAEIYAGGGYEFTVAYSRDTSTPVAESAFEFTGVKIYAGGRYPMDSRITMLTARNNEWFSDTRLSMYTASVARYRNRMVWDRGNFAETINGVILQSAGGAAQRVYAGGLARLGDAVARDGDYVNAILSSVNATSTTADDKAIAQTLYVGADVAPDDRVWTGTFVPPIINTADDPYPYGYWSFNRQGNKAVTVSWATDRTRFGAPQPAILSTPTLGFVTSYVVEVTFANGAVVNVTKHETPDFCIAADYDWTVEGDAILTVNLRGYDYRVAKATEWTPYATTIRDLQTQQIRPIQVDDYFKTTYVASDNSSITRPGKIYRVAAIVPPSGDRVGATPWTGATISSGDFLYQDVTEQPSAMDETMTVSYLGGSVLRSYELLHNRDWKTNNTATGTWYQKSGDQTSICTNITGMDLRVRGVTAYAVSSDASGNPASSTFATVYNRDWVVGSNLPSTGTSITSGNFYHPHKLYERIKLYYVNQTIACIPYLYNPFQPRYRDLAVYAPCGDPTQNADPSKAIDFMVEDTTSEFDESKIQYGYHANTFAKLYTVDGVTPFPYKGRYFQNGCWAKRKGKDGL